jgi:hypothetical protein
MESMLVIYIPEGKLCVGERNNWCLRQNGVLLDEQLHHSIIAVVIDALMVDIA